MEGVIAVSFPIIISLGVFAMIFGMRNLENKERMAMIERGMEPPQKAKRNPSATLRSALFFVGAGFGLLMAVFATNLLPGLDDGESTALYFGFISIGAGLGLLVSFLYDKKMEREGNDSWNK